MTMAIVAAMAFAAGVVAGLVIPAVWAWRIRRPRRW
jgi:hypothetical protein